ncbi:MAG: hypothetical protein IPL79_19930 [Myxococcales bacterium]|nr:hypothetical protein [Myxococcales bacterium]
MVVVKVHALSTANKKKRKDLERAEGLLAGAVEEARALEEKIAGLRVKVKRLRAEAAKLTTPAPPPGVDLDGPAEQPRCKGRRGS